MHYLDFFNGPNKLIAFVKANAKKITPSYLGRNSEKKNTITLDSMNELYAFFFFFLISCLIHT